MNPKPEKVRVHLLNSYCTIFPDSCVFLNYIFAEEEFRPKIEFLLNVAKIPCEVLPKISNEVTKKLLDAANDYVTVARKCSDLSSAILNLPLENIYVNKDIAAVFEAAFKEIYADVYRQTTLSLDRKRTIARRIRVIETSILLSLWSIIENENIISLKQFFDGLEYEFGEKYIEFGDREAEFLTKMNAKKLQSNDILEVEPTFNLFRLCGVSNPNDIIVLNEALGRMYKSNKWGAIVSTDINDMVKNKVPIERKTQLIVTDPLYCLFKLDKKIDFAMKPTEAASKCKLDYRAFFKKPNDGVV
jgi:hypothetical protein